MITLYQIQQELAKAIKQSGLSQSEIARRLGVKHTQISCYVHGKKMPALDTLANLCVIIDVDPADILCTNDRRTTEEKAVRVSDSFNNNSGSINFKA